MINTSIFTPSSRLLHVGNLHFWSGVVVGLFLTFHSGVSVSWEGKWREEWKMRGSRIGRVLTCLAPSPCVCLGEHLELKFSLLERFYGLIGEVSSTLSSGAPSLAISLPLHSTPSGFMGHSAMCQLDISSLRACGHCLIHKKHLGIIALGNSRTFWPL